MAEKVLKNKKKLLYSALGGSVTLLIVAIVLVVGHFFLGWFKKCAASGVTHPSSSNVLGSSSGSPPYADTNTVDYALFMTNGAGLRFLADGAGCQIYQHNLDTPADVKPCIPDYTPLGVYDTLELTEEQGTCIAGLIASGSIKTFGCGSPD